MRGKGLLLLGVIAGAIFATTPQGKKVIGDVKRQAQDAWAQPNVQRTVRDIQGQVRDRVPVVGDSIADAIDGLKPAPKVNPAG